VQKEVQLLNKQTSGAEFIHKYEICKFY